MGFFYYDNLKSNPSLYLKVSLSKVAWRHFLNHSIPNIYWINVLPDYKSTFYYFHYFWFLILIFRFICRSTDSALLSALSEEVFIMLLMQFNSFYEMCLKSVLNFKRSFCWILKFRQKHALKLRLSSLLKNSSIGCSVWVFMGCIYLVQVMLRLSPNFRLEMILASSADLFLTLSKSILMLMKVSHK